MPRDHADHNTQWSKLERLHSDCATESWSWFISRYRQYVIAVLRRLLWKQDSVEAATEEFWGYLFSSRALERADRSGRFRSFLSGVLRNYASVWIRGNAPRPTLGEQDAQVALPHGLPEAEELSLWAQQILHLGLERLGREYPAEERALRLFYGVPDQPGGDARPRQRATAIAAQIGCIANAMHQTLFRARTRLRDCIAVEVAATIGTSAQLQDELVLLTAAVGSAAPGIVEGAADEGDA
jgi:DNA-directed RNA polymerase specialized sigma24 family protein